MHVSIRDATLRAAGFDDLGEGLRHFGLDSVELEVGRDLRVRALAPAPRRTHLFLNDGGDVTELAAQMESTGFRVPAFLLASDFQRARPGGGDRLARAGGRDGGAAPRVPVVRIDAILRAKQDLPAEVRGVLRPERARQVLDGTDGQPVDLGIENHGAKGNTRAFLDALLASVDSPAWA